MKKYLRIQVRYTGKTGQPVGIFGACHHTVNNTYHNFNASQEDKQLFEKTEEWFEKNLPNPPCYENGNPQKCITWFKTDTTNYMVEQLQPLMGILNKYNVPHDVIFSDFVGKIIYEDEFQVAVVPS
jgi:hypothetical protein